MWRMARRGARRARGGRAARGKLRRARGGRRRRERRGAAEFSKRCARRRARSACSSTTRRGEGPGWLESTSDDSIRVAGTTCSPACGWCAAHARHARAGFGASSSWARSEPCGGLAPPTAPPRRPRSPISRSGWRRSSPAPEYHEHGEPGGRRHRRRCASASAAPANAAGGESSERRHRGSSGARSRPRFHAEPERARGARRGSRRARGTLLSPAATRATSTARTCASTAARPTQRCDQRRGRLPTKRPPPGLTKQPWSKVQN